MPWWKGGVEESSSGKATRKQRALQNRDKMCSPKARPRGPPAATPSSSLSAHQSTDYTEAPVTGPFASELPRTVSHVSFGGHLTSEP